MSDTMEIYWEFKFEAAHRLPNVPSDHKCSRLHGHSYQVQVHVTGPVEAQSGWVIDFGTIKDACKPVIDRLDHYYLNEITGLEKTGFRPVRFAKRRNFGEQEIRRLGPATGFYRSMIAVEWSAQNGFQITGMIHTGAWSRDLTVAVDSLNHPIPDWLIIHVRGPGNLVIHRGSERIVTLLNGRVEGHGFDLFASSWFLRRYRTKGDGFTGEITRNLPDSVVIRDDLAEDAEALVSVGDIVEDLALVGDDLLPIFQVGVERDERV